MKDFNRADDTSILDYLEMDFEHISVQDVANVLSKFEKICLNCLSRHVPGKAKKKGKNTWFTKDVMQVKLKLKKNATIFSAPEMSYALTQYAD